MAIELAEPVDAASSQAGSMLHKVSRQSAVVFLTRGASLLLGVGSLLVLSRLLGPAGLGKFRLGSVVVQLVTGCSLIGLDRALMRYLPVLDARGEGGARSLILRSGATVLGISLIASVALFFGAPLLATYYFHSSEMTNVMRAFCLQLPILALFRFVSGAVTAARRIDISAKVTNILSPAIFLGLLLAGMVLSAGVYGAIAARTVAQFVATAALIVFLMRKYSAGGKGTGGVTLRKHLSLSIPLFIIGIGYQLLNQMDTIMLGHFVSQRDVGIYSIAFKVSAFVFLGSEILLPIVAPLFSHFSETKASDMTKTLFVTVTKWLCYSAAIVFVCIVLFRAELLTLFGKEFVGGTTVLLILGAGQLANAATGPTGVLLTMTGKQRWELTNIICLVVFNFILNLFLIPRFGMTGAAMATGLSIFTINLLKLVQVYLLYGLQAYSPSYLKGFAAIGSGCVVAWLVRNGSYHLTHSPYAIIPLGCMAFVLVVLGGFWLLGLEPEDKMALQALRRRKKKGS